MRNSVNIAILSGLMLMAACSTTSNKIAALKPPAEYTNAEVVYDRQTSFINLPVEISVNDLQNQTNKYLQGLIYEDKVLEGDNIMMKVWKQAPISVTEKNGKLYMDLPLKIWTKVRYGVEKFGISAFDTREINLNGKIKLSSVASLNNWKLSSKTTIEDIEWTESPSVSVAGKNIPITYLINPALSFFKSDLSKTVDEAIAESGDIKPYVLTALEQVSKPMEVNTGYQAWFAIQPLELYATKAIVANKKITINLGMKAFLETSVGRKPTLAFDKTKLQLKAVDKMPNQFSVNVASFSTYQNAAAVMQKNFAGQRFGEGKKSVVVTKVDLWGKDNKLIVDLGMTGAINGEVYLSGLPKYDPVKKEIYLDEVDFVMDSKNKLLKTADWLVHGLIVKKITENCRFSIAEQLNEGTKTMSSYLANYHPTKGVTVNGSLAELAPNKVFLTPNAIVAMIAAKGKISVAIDGLE